MEKITSLQTEQIVSGLLVLAGLVAIHFITNWLIRRLKLAKYKNLKTIKLAVRLLLFVSLVYFVAVRYLDLGHPYLLQAYELSMIYLFAWLLIGIVGINAEILQSRFDLSQDDNIEARKVTTQIGIFVQIINVVIVVIATSLALMTFDSIRSIGTSLLASAGILGIVVGFATQKLIGNVIAGFQIAVTQPIRIDDAVVVEGEWGRVEELTLTYAVIRLWDRRRLIIPSLQIIEKPLTNWTRTRENLIGTVFIYSDYSLPVEELRKELTKILESTPMWDGEVNVLQVTNATESTMELRILVSGKVNDLFALRALVREQLIAYIRKNHPNSLPKTRVTMEQDANKRLNDSL